MFRIGNSRETKSWCLTVGLGVWVGNREWRVLRDKVSFKGDENVLELLVKVAYSCEYKKHPGVYT